MHVRGGMVRGRDPRCRRWSDDGCLTLEVGPELDTPPAHWYFEWPWTDCDGTPFPSVVAAAIASLFPREVFEAKQTIDTFLVEIDVHSQGYYEPASMYGGADHVGWPEEGEDERVVTGATVLPPIAWTKMNGGYDRSRRRRLPQWAVDVLEGWYQKEIDDLVIPHEEPEPPERDDE